MAVLIVDNEKTIREALRFALEKKDILSVEAENSMEAIELINIREFDLFIIDLNMPVVSGIDLIKILREEGISAPVIVLTGQDINDNHPTHSLLNPIQIISKDLPVIDIVTVIEETMMEAHSEHYPKKV